MAPVQVKVTTPALIAVAEMVTVKALAAKAEEVGSAVPEGAVNLQAGAAGQAKLFKGMTILPDAEMAWIAVKVVVTVTAVAAAAELDKVTAAPVKVPQTATSVPVMEASMLAPAED